MLRKFVLGFIFLLKLSSTTLPAQEYDTLNVKAVTTSDWAVIDLFAFWFDGSFLPQTLKFYSDIKLKLFNVSTRRIDLVKAERRNTDTVEVRIKFVYPKDTTDLRIGLAKGSLGTTFVEIRNSDDSLLHEFIDNETKKSIYDFKEYRFSPKISTAIGNNNEISKSYRLDQNYPNPFNPSTTIEFEMPIAENVNIKIYDVKGRLVKTLLDEWKPLGKHSIIWDGKNNSGIQVAAGMYFYIIQVGNFLQAKKMVLLK